MLHAWLSHGITVINMWICEGSVTGKKGYVAVSTTSIYGEDIQCKGRVSVETITRQYSTIK